MLIQSDLFSHDVPSLVIDGSFATAKRTLLDRDSWIDIVPDCVSGAQSLFERLIDAAAWKQRDRVLFDKTFREPRLTAEYRLARDAPDPSLISVMNALSHHYRVPYDGLWMNLYRDGHDSTAWHRDRVSCRWSDTVVPVLSLGATRRFHIKPYAGGRSVVFKPRSGDLIVMGGRCQDDWVHAVLKEPGVTEARISVNFQSTVQSRN